MDALAASSFLSSSTLPSITTRRPPISTHIPPLKISAARLEEKQPQSLTAPSPQSSSKSQLHKPPPPPARRNIPKKGGAAETETEPSLGTFIFSALEDVINNFIDPPLRSSVDPRYVLSQNFAPVDELPPTECEVIEGSLPPCLDGGAYIRNGPNPQFLPRGPYHLFDGDGMLHSISISQGRPVFCNRFVKTYKYTIERRAGSPILPNVFSGFNSLTGSAARGALCAARILSGQLNPINGIGLANTSLSLFGGRLYALGESDLPYSLRLTPDGDIETVGRDDFDGKLVMSMTAHPKVDPETGEAFAFRYGPVPPFLTYFWFDAQGRKQPDVPIFSLTTPSLLHDFGITKKYAIFADTQIGMNPIEMINGGSPVGAVQNKVPRLGIIPRYAKDESEMRWFNVAGLNIVHCINAWDEEEEGENAITMVAPNILSVEHTLERLDMIHASVEKVRIDLKTGMVTRHPLSTRNLDFAVINTGYLGKKNKYVYAAVGDPMPKISGVVKLDISQAERKECIVGSRMYGEGCYGGEPFFVARKTDNTNAEEDDGYVVSYVHNEKSGESRFIVMDARTPTLDIVAAVKLPRRVPYGFHGLFVRESDILNTNKERGTNQ